MTTPLSVSKIQLFVNDRSLNLLTASAADLWSATSVSFTFTTQKNGVRGEIVSHGLSGHDMLCPVRAVIHCILHL